MKTEPKHKTEVKGYEGRLQLLSELIHLMRYDEVAQFYGHSALELRRQAENDRTGGRLQLAALLEEAANAAEDQQRQFARIWKLCEPYMRE